MKRRHNEVLGKKTRVQSRKKQLKICIQVAIKQKMEKIPTEEIIQKKTPVIKKESLNIVQNVMSLYLLSYVVVELYMILLGLPIAYLSKFFSMVHCLFSINCL